MADITVNATITMPGFTIDTPFGPHEVPGKQEQVTVTLHIDEAAAAAIAALVKG